MSDEARPGEFFEPASKFRNSLEYSQKYLSWFLKCPPSKSNGFPIQGQAARMPCSLWAV
ncbi:hypothetical protein [Paracoccus sp. (in: a-proteobacteria)]|uniref:hypothetical protein n=1 Tax=Paracoccus sp. TaxID=267 RepID=UPI003A83EB82